jgi:hypothetical protein
MSKFDFNFGRLNSLETQGNRLLTSEITLIIETDDKNLEV